MPIIHVMGPQYFSSIIGACTIVVVAAGRPRRHSRQADKVIKRKSCVSASLNSTVVYCPSTASQIIAPRNPSLFSPDKSCVCQGSVGCQVSHKHLGCRRRAPCRWGRMMRSGACLPHAGIPCRPALRGGAIAPARPAFAGRKANQVFRLPTGCRQPPDRLSCSRTRPPEGATEKQPGRLLQQGAVCCMHTLPIVSRGGAPSPRCGDVRRRSHEAPAVARPIFGCCPEAGVRLSPRHATATDAYQAAQGLGNAGAWASGPRPRDWAAHAAPARRDPPRGATRTWAPESSRCPRFLSGASVRRATRAFRRTRGDFTHPCTCPLQVSPAPRDLPHPAPRGGRLKNRRE